MNRTFLESGFVITKLNESMNSQNESMFLTISYTIPASLRNNHKKQVKKFTSFFFQQYGWTTNPNATFKSKCVEKKLISASNKIYFLSIYL